MISPRVVRAWFRPRVSAQVSGAVANGAAHEPHGTSRSTSESILAMQDVVFNYPHTPVLRGVTMQVREGEVLSIVGASGCGKTTLLNMLAGFVLPQSGQVLMDGRPVTSGGPERA